MNKRNIIASLGVIFSYILLVGITLNSNAGSQNSLSNPSSTPAMPRFPDSKTIAVLQDYPTISSAANASSPGDTILVKAGTYVESVTVDKSLTTKGENKEQL